MMRSFRALKWSSLLVVLGQFSALCLLAFIVAADFINPENRSSSDYHTSFYVAGYLVNHNMINDLYPPLNATTLAGTPFDRVTHQLLPLFPAGLVGIFMYSPLVAILSAPFSHFQPTMGLLCLQLAGVGALILNAWLQSRTSPGTGSGLFWTTFLFFPIFSTLWIGQVSLVFGLLPLAIGYFLMCRNKPILAGIAWSFCMLKPQYLIVPIMTSLCLGLQKQWKYLLALGAGILVLTAATYLCMGKETFELWLHSLKLSETLFSGTTIRSPVALIASLPGTILELLPAAARADFKLLAYAVGASVSALVLWISSRLPQSEDRTARSFLLTLLALPLISPRLLIYDLAIWFAGGSIITATTLQGHKVLRPMVLIVWLLIDVCVMAIVVASQQAVWIPILLMSAILVLNIGLWSQCLRDNQSAK